MLSPSSLHPAGRKGRSAKAIHHLPRLAVALEMTDSATEPALPREVAVPATLPPPHRQALRPLLRALDADAAASTRLALPGGAAAPRKSPPDLVE